jgi:hypothetical protein
MGIPIRTARTTTLDDWLTRTPPAITAHALGYHPNTTEEHAGHINPAWAGYPRARRNV